MWDSYNVKGLQITYYSVYPLIFYLFSTIKEYSSSYMVLSKFSWDIKFLSSSSPPMMCGFGLVPRVCKQFIIYTDYTILFTNFIQNTLI